MYEFSVADVLGYLNILRTGSDTNRSARQGDHFEVMLVQQIAQSFWAITVVFQQVVTQLNTAKSNLGDVLDRLQIISAPGNCRIAEANVRGRWRNWAIKVREINIWI